MKKNLFRHMEEVLLVGFILYTVQSNTLLWL